MEKQLRKKQKNDQLEQLKRKEKKEEKAQLIVAHKLENEAVHREKIRKIMTQN